MTLGPFYSFEKYEHVFTEYHVIDIKHTQQGSEFFQLVNCNIWRKNPLKSQLQLSKNEHYHLRQLPKMNDMATPSYRETNKKFYMLLGRNMIFLPYQTENKRRNNLVVPLQVNI